MSRVIEVTETAKSDLTGKPATESRTLTYQGVTFELDLTEQEAGVFDRTIGKYTSRAHVAVVDPSVLRDWARGQGHEVGERGRMAGDLQEAFIAALRGEDAEPETVDA